MELLTDKVIFVIKSVEIGEMSSTERRIKNVDFQLKVRIRLGSKSS